MQLPIQITFKHMARIEEIESIVRKRAEKLDTFAERIMSCRVVIEPSGKHRKRGNLYAVHLDIKLPGTEIAITREPAEHIEHKHVEITIRDAFDSAERQVEEYVRRQRGEVKSRMTPPQGVVTKILPAEDCGFLETADGREVYFHRNSVLNDEFDRLQSGSEVSFAEEKGEKGPQASTVKLVGRHGSA